MPDTCSHLSVAASLEMAVATETTDQVCDLSEEEQVKGNRFSSISEKTTQ